MPPSTQAENVHKNDVERKSPASKQQQVAEQTLIWAASPQSVLQAAMRNPHSLTPGRVAQLQRAFGNQALGAAARFAQGQASTQKPATKQSPTTSTHSDVAQRQEQQAETEEEEAQQESSLIQAKLTLGATDDPYEQEADRVARQVVQRLPVSSSVVANSPIEAQSPLQQQASQPENRVDATVERSIQAKRGNGQRLSDDVRTPMEQAFGANFGDVHIHTDSEADRLNRKVQARAFTTGRDVFFRKGEYQPRNDAGKELLAHELTHVVQQGGVSIHVNRQAKSVTEQSNDTTDEQRKEPSISEQVLTLVAKDVTGMDFKRDWETIKKQIIAPVVHEKPRGKYKWLYEKDLVTKLVKLSGDDRLKLANTLTEQSVQKLTGKSLKDVTDEYNQLDIKVVQRYIEGGFTGFVAMRNALFNSFGSIEMMNKYYKTLTPAVFPSNKVRGSGTIVHPELKSRLDAAARLLQSRKKDNQSWFEIAEANIRTVGGFNIRENRNRPDQLSDHSFGWAIDIDPALNPNIEMQPANRKSKSSKNKITTKQLIQELTGVDVYEGSEITTLKAGGKADALLASAQALRSSSDSFKGIFENEESLKRGFINYLKKKGLVITDDDTTALLILLKGEPKTNKKSKKGNDVLIQVEKWLSDVKAQQDEKPQPWADQKSTSDQAQMSIKPWDEAKGIAALLQETYRIFQGTHTPKGAKVSPQTQGTSQTIAAHGFLNLPAELITALTASDGGDLKWLGTSLGTKDFMHFELKKEQRPILPKEETKSTSTKTDINQQTKQVASGQPTIQRQSISKRSITYTHSTTGVTGLTLVAPQNLLLKEPIQPPTDSHQPLFEEYKGRSINKFGKVSAPENQYQIAKADGVNVRAKPDGNLPHITKVLFGTGVQVQALDKTGEFYFIIADTGAVGWINKDFVAIDPPDSGAKIHHITESNLTTILNNEYVTKKLWNLSTGNDYTTLAAAVIVANKERAGVWVDWDKVKKYKDDHSWKEFLDPWMIDNFAIYHGSEIKLGHNIWLPSPSYIRMLQSSGVIGSRPGWINTAVDLGQGITGFYSGAISGIFGSLWDTLSGLWELGKSIVSTIRSVLDGSLFASIEAIYDQIKSMSWNDLEKLVDDIITMGKNAFSDFNAKWNQPDTYKQWHFRGYVIGAVALEVVLAIFTGGAALGAKVLAKIGKYFPKLMNVLNKLLALADKLPGRRGRHHPDKPGKHKDKDHNGDHGDKDMTHDDRAWEQARIMASIITEQHDIRNTPVKKLIPLLNGTIATRFKIVKGYKPILIGKPNTYKIIQAARRNNVVDKHYSENAEIISGSDFFTDLYGKSKTKVLDRAHKIRWTISDKLHSGRGFVIKDQNGVERFRYRIAKKPGHKEQIRKDGTRGKPQVPKPKFLHEETGYIRWADENGILLDIDGKKITSNGTPIRVQMKGGEIRQLCGNNEQEVDRVMQASHISVGLLGGGDW